MEASATSPTTVASDRSIRGFGGGSFAVRLIALCLVPTLGLVWLGSIRLSNLNRSVSEAEQVVEQMELQRNLFAVSDVAQSERLALAGLAITDGLGAPRFLITQIVNIDLEALQKTTSEELDTELDELESRLSRMPEEEASGLLHQLQATRIDLEAQRQASDQFRSDPTQIDAVFDSLGTIARNTPSFGGLDARGTSVVVAPHLRLDALLDVVLSANDYATAIMNALLSAGDDEVIAVERGAAVHETELQTFLELLGDDPGPAIDELQRLLDEATTAVGALVGTFQLDSGATVTEMGAAAPLLAIFDYLNHLSTYSEEFRATVLAEAQQLASTVRSDARRTEIAMYAIAVVTLALIALIAVSTVTPLRRLGRRAQDIVDGELVLEPLPVRGPRVVRALTATVNEMLATLHRVDRQISGLASGTASTDAVDIPGTIGNSLRESVDHLAQVTAQLQTSERRASAIVAQAADAIWAIDGDGIIRTSNQASEHLLRVDSSEQVGRPLTDFLASIDGETPVIGRPDMRVHVSSSGVADTDQLVTVIARDLSERFQFEERLAHQARHDALTMLPNRFAVLERLEELHDADESVAVLFIDIDGFKSVNDTKGHAAGDRVLTEIGRRLKESIRPIDYVARLGGDEFVVLARDVTDVIEIQPFGRRLIEKIELPYNDDGSVFTLSASIGVAIMDDSVIPLESLRRADSAVYVAKRHGRGRIEAFDAQLQASIQHDAELALALRDAIKSDELVLHYQPIIDLETGQVCGVEALVRWNRPNVGMIPPNEFISIAERSAMIVDLERWVINDACATLAAWNQRVPSPNITMAINISGRHLVDGDLVADLDHALQHTGVDPQLLVFELTETQLLEDVERATAVLEEIRRRGITVSVDDFGTGYSSMTYLRDLPIDVIKIDRTFLASAIADGQDEPLVDAMLTIGRSLDLKVVAEGVETEQQLAYVKTRGCDYAQGFFFARPLPVVEAEEMIFGALTPAR